MLFPLHVQKNSTILGNRSHLRLIKFFLKEIIVITPSATVVAERQCFHKRLSFYPGAGRHPLLGRHPPPEQTLS